MEDVKRQIEKSDPKNKVVLVVDDDALTQFIMIQMVNSLGYHAKAADDGWTGLSQIHNAKPAAVIMDMSMPHLDGFAATLLIREMFTKQELPIIACTAERSVTNRKRGFAYGMNDWIHKPVHPVHLRPILRRWLEAKPYSIAEPVSDVESLNYLPTCDHRVLELVYSKGRTSDSFATRKKYVNDFLLSSPKLINDVGNFVKAGKFQDAAVAVRKLKQSSVVVGAPRLSRLCEILDRMLNHLRPHTEDVSIKHVRDEFLILKEVLERRYGLFDLSGPSFSKQSATTTTVFVPAPAAQVQN